MARASLEGGTVFHSRWDRRPELENFVEITPPREASRTGRSDAGDLGERYHLRWPPELTPEIAGRRWRELNSLLHSLVTLHGGLRDRKPFQPILHSASTIVPAPKGILYLWEEPLRSLRMEVSFGFPLRLAGRAGSGDLMAAAALQCRKPILLNDPPEEAIRVELQSLGAPCCLIVPILRRGLPWGAIQLVRREPFAEDEAVLLWMYALILEEALPGIAESTRLPESLPPPNREIGLVDLPEFEAKLDWEIERSGWIGRPCSLLRLGWRPGDHPNGEAPEGLRQGRSLRAIRRSLRPVDQVAPWRGHDLLISLPDLDSLEARRVVQEIRRNLVQSRALGEEGAVVQCLRLAFATYPVHGRTREDLIRALEVLFEESGSAPEGMERPAGDS